MRIRLEPAALTAAIILAVSAAAPALAVEPPEDFTRDGWYLTLQGVYAMEDFDDGEFEREIGAVNVGVDHDDGWGGNLHAGYRFLQNFALELEFEYADAFESNVDPSGVNFGIKTRTWTFAFNGKVYPFTRLTGPSGWLARIQPFVTAGTAWQWVDTYHGGDYTDGDFAGRAGGGLDVYITENFVWSSTAAYNFGTGDVKDFRYLSIGTGLQYRFGVPE